MTSKTYQKIVIIMLSIMAHQNMVANEESDTLPAQQLNEIVVQAPKIIRKADMDIYYPSRSAVYNSRNGLQLLGNLMIPSLTVTEAFGSIQASGEAVQVRINGRIATIDQVKALLPQTIKRVEWIDTPGLRYQGSNYVLNIVVTNPSLGGSLQTDGAQALNTAWGNYSINTKLNNGPSQFEIGAMFKLSNKIKSHREYSENFTYPDGTSLSRNETPIGGSIDNTFGKLWGAYSYIKPDTTVVYIEASLAPTFSDNVTSHGILSLSDGSEDILLTDSHGSKSTTHKFSAYIEHHFANRQTIVLDFNSSFYFGKSYSDYIETLQFASDKLTDIHTLINDHNQAYAVEANYIKAWQNSRLTSGASYTAKRNRSVYENLGGCIFHQRQDIAYFFAEYMQRINKVTITAGLGAQYTHFLFKETMQGNRSWNMRPQASLSYRLNGRHQIRLSFQSWQSAPSLSESNIAPLQLDGFQWRIGNPDLKTSTSYMLTLRYNFTFPRVSGTLGTRAFSSPDAITPYLYWESGKLITSYENSRGLQNLTFFLSPQIEIIPDWLMASGHIQYKMERMRGRNYTRYNHNWSGNVSIMFYHRGFELTGQYVRAQHDLWGEKISWGENLSLIQLAYNLDKWQFGAGIIMPFGKYDQGSKMLSHWNTNEQHMRINMRMPYICISYNLQWGRQKRGANKIINAEAKADASSAGGR